MIRVKLVALVSALVAMCALVAAVSAQERKPRGEGQTEKPVPQPKDVYAVKFLCGTFKNGHGDMEGPVKPGNYLTAINVHSPNEGLTLVISKKAILLYRADQPPKEPEMRMPPYPRIEVGLDTDWGLEIDCGDIRKVLLQGSSPLPSAPPAPTFIKGWVILEVRGDQSQSPLPLDVTAVYTSHGFTKSGGDVVPDGFAVDVEQILPRRVISIWDPNYPKK
jgi:hypothetical protein